MAARLWGTIITRLTAPPLALKVHAALVLTASFIVRDSGRGGSWFGPVAVVVLLWPLLRGSRFVWWVQLLGLGIVLVAAGGAYGKIVDGPPGFDVFVDLPTYVAATTAVGAAWLLLLLPSVRRYCSEHPRRSAFVFVIGVYLLASFPAMAVGLDSRVPSPLQVEQTQGAVFVGGAGDAPIAFYVADRRHRTCLVALAPGSTVRGCAHERRLLRYPLHLHVRDVLAGVVPRTAERVKAGTESGARWAQMIVDERVGVNVFFLLDAPEHEVLLIVGYDASGAEIFRDAGDY